MIRAPPGGDPRPGHGDWGVAVAPVRCAHPGDAAGSATVGSVREVFAHDAVLRVASGGDVRAPGAAITVALCGHWDHEPPCPLAPHHVAATPDGDVVRLRVLFAAEPADEAEVRRRISQALGSSRLLSPDGQLTEWVVRSTAPGRVRPDEADRARQLQ